MANMRVYTVINMGGQEWFMCFTMDVGCEYQ